MISPDTRSSTTKRKMLLSDLAWVKRWLHGGIKETAELKQLDDDIARAKDAVADLGKTK